MRRERDGRDVYSVHVYRRFLEALLHGVIHGYKISMLYYLKVEGGAFPARLAVGQFRLVGLTETREDEGVGCCKHRAV